MAVRITPFSHQNMVLNTPYSLNVPVSGNPDEVLVSGRLKGLSYHWNNPQNRIEIRGTPMNYAKDEEIVITAYDQRFTGTFSVLPVTPVIGALSRVIVQRGVNTTIPIPITGNITDLIIKGPWIGLHYRQTDSGGELYGSINSGSEFTSRTFNYSIEAYNNLGGHSVFDTATLTVEIGI